MLAALSPSLSDLPRHAMNKTNPTIIKLSFHFRLGSEGGFWPGQANERVTESAWDPGLLLCPESTSL